LRALDAISFDIARGEVLGVVGESGAGKSVTGSAIIGLIDPPGPHRRRRGRAVGASASTTSRPMRCAGSGAKRIGMIFQDPLTSLNPLYRIGEQLIETIRPIPT
jgi:peptide/nickel transport system ATP-binding protein